MGLRASTTSLRRSLTRNSSSSGWDMCRISGRLWARVMCYADLILRLRTKAQRRSWKPKVTGCTKSQSDGAAHDGASNRGLRHNVASFVEIVQRGFDYHSEAYVTPNDLESVRKFLGNQPMSARPEDVITNVINQPNRSYSRVESNAASLMISNEWFTPAWKVRVNGINQPRCV